MSKQAAVLILDKLNCVVSKINHYKMFTMSGTYNILTAFASGKLHLQLREEARHCALGQSADLPNLRVFSSGRWEEAHS